MQQELEVLQPTPILGQKMALLLETDPTLPLIHSILERFIVLPLARPVVHLPPLNA